MRLIGLLYKIPMTRILGDEGIGYYNTAYEIYNIGLILSSYSLPLAVSKLIAGKEQEGRREDAKKVFHCGIFVGVVTGGLMSLFLIVCSDRIAAEIFNSPGSALPLRVMAPTILVFAVMGVFRGFSRAGEIWFPPLYPRWWNSWSRRGQHLGFLGFYEPVCRNGKPQLLRCGGGNPRNAGRSFGRFCDSGCLDGGCQRKRRRAVAVGGGKQRSVRIS